MTKNFTLAQEFTVQWERQGVAKKASALLNKAQWSRLGCDGLPAALAVVFYDSAACLGTDKAMRLLQKVMNIVGEAHLDIYIPVPIDGLCTFETLALCRALQKVNLDFYAARMAVRHRAKMYACRCHVRMAQETTEDWKVRCQGLLEYLARLEREEC